MDENQLIILRDNDFLEKLRIAGKCTAMCLKTARDIILDTKEPNLLFIESECINVMKTFGCSATFLNYKGFPGAICTSVNTEMVHGIPRSYIIQEGDVVKIDLGSTYEGAIADAAITVIKGNAKDKKHVELVNTCKLALDTSINMIQVGKRLGCIGSSIHRTCKNTSFGLITNYGGHGISCTEDNKGIPHAQPFVSNKANTNDGVRLQNGMVLAIEPMLTMSDTNTRVLDDGWTVVTKDISAHFEHTIFVHNNKAEVLTKIE